MHKKFIVAIFCATLWQLMLTSAARSQQTYYEMPMLTPSDGAPYITAFVNLKTPGMFCMDTGSSNCRMDREFARQQQLEIYREKLADITVEYVFCDVRLGNSKLNLKHNRFVLGDFSAIRQQHPDFVGIIGAEVFKEFALVLDYTDKTVGVYLPGKLTLSDEKNPGMIRLPLVKVDNLYFVDAKVNDKDIRFLLDTGSDRSTLSLTAQKQIGKPDAELFGEEVVSVADAGKKFIEQPAVLQQYQSLAVGTAKWDKPIFLSATRASDLLSERNLLGAEFLSKYHVIADIPGSMLYLLPVRELESEKIVGTGLRFQVTSGKGISVSGVYSPSSASSKGIKAGWKILEYGGIKISASNATKETSEQIMAMEKEAGKSIEVVFERNGKKERVLLETRKLL